MPARLHFCDIFFLIILFEIVWRLGFYLSVKLTSVCITAFLWFSFQIQNADDVLITPLEKFRKEQIGAAKVRDHLHVQLVAEQHRIFHVFWHAHLLS